MFESIVETIWQGIVEKADLIAAAFGVPSFLVWSFYGVVIIVIAVMVAWFFPILRGVSGAVFFGVIAALWGFRRGQLDERAYQEQKKRKTKK
jgi:hypothetical protein